MTKTTMKDEEDDDVDQRLMKSKKIHLQIISKENVRGNGRINFKSPYRERKIWKLKKKKRNDWKKA